MNNEWIYFKNSTSIMLNIKIKESCVLTVCVIGEIKWRDMLSSPYDRNEISVDISAALCTVIYVVQVLRLKDI